MGRADHDDDHGSDGGGRAHAVHRPHAAHGGGAHEEHEGAPEWLISFADNVALLMGFFVILLAMNMKEPTVGGIGGREKNGGAPPSPHLIDSVIAIREAFNSPVDLNSQDPADQILIRRILERRGEGRSIQPGDHGEAREMQALGPTDRSSLGGVVTFPDESAELDEEQARRAAEIGRRLAGTRWVVEVRGHASPWETWRDVDRAMALSHARAMAAARVLVAQGVRWEQLRLVACGTGEPAVGWTYERSSDRPNQRVDIVATTHRIDPGS